MKYMHEYRDKEIAQKLIQHIKSVSKKQVRLMEVCGGHTMAIRKYGIHTLLPDTIELLSGPGCPVCVTGQDFIDKAIALAQIPDVIITTYGDLMRVPGSQSSLDQAKAQGADIRIIYSTLEAVKLAVENPDKKIVFLGIGFETTTPSTAISLEKAKKDNIDNYFVLSVHKTMPNAMAALIDGGSQIDGYIGPGHVSTVAGSKIYDNLVKQHKLSIVISGFEPIDILQTILLLVKQLEQDTPKLEIQYKRAVKINGNLKAQELVEEVFEPCKSYWRGIGSIPDSGLKIRDNYSQYDAEKQFDLKINQTPEPKGCICGSILKGQNKPTDCKLFGKTCVPENPVGACMVSGEGTCAAYYRYR